MSLRELNLCENRLTSLPAETQVTSLEVLCLSDNKLTSVPAEIGQLTSLTGLGLWGNQLNLNGHNPLTSLPADGDRAAQCGGLPCGGSTLTGDSGSSRR